MAHEVDISHELKKLVTRDATAAPLFQKIGPCWRGGDNLNSLTVFGDSYSSNQIDEPTWVNHLSSLEGYQGNLHCYSFPGATAQDDIDLQVSRFLEDDMVKLNQIGSLFDVDDLEDVVESLFDSLHKLYVQSPARNFLLLDVPPIDRAPGASGLSVDFQERVEKWNEMLLGHTEDFASTTAQSTMFLFSSHRFLSQILDDPEKYGFNKTDATDPGGAIWVDDLHLTSIVHEKLAQQVFATLTRSVV